MTPDEELDLLDHALDQFHEEHPDTRGLLRLPISALRSCSKWKWQMHGWTISDGESCGIMNGTERDRHTALLAILKTHGIERIEFVADAAGLEVVPDRR